MAKHPGSRMIGRLQARRAMRERRGGRVTEEVTPQLDAVIAAVLGLPLVSTIGLLVFIGAIMLGGVVLVQQIEAHVLQPFLMGRFVSVHPLGVIIAVATGVLVAGPHRRPRPTGTRPKERWTLG